METIDFDKLRATWVTAKETRVQAERRVAPEKAEKTVRQSVNEYSDMLRQGKAEPKSKEILYDVSCEDARGIVDRIVLANPTLKDTISVRCTSRWFSTVVVENP